MANGSKNLKAIISVVFAIIALVSGFFVVRNKSNEPDHIVDGKMYVDFIDVGQGDCTLLRTSEAVILVDAGEVGEAENVIDYLKEKDVTRIDCCIATHPHSDHIGSLAVVFNEFEVDTVILPDIDEKNEPTTRTYENFILALDNVKNIVPVLGSETFEFGDLKVDIFGPLKQYEDLNDMSVVSTVSYGSTSVMLTGDAEIITESDMLDVPGVDYSAQLLKVGHHGSRTSTSVEWLEAVDPDYAVISCGTGNDYGHPHKETLEKFDDYGIKYYRTDLSSDITFESDGKNFNLIKK